MQHIIEQNGYEMWKLIAQNNAYIFVAGNSKNMPDSVKNAFISSYSKFGNVNRNDSEIFFERLELHGRYQTETWS